MSAVLEVKNLRKIYPKQSVPAVNDISFSLKAGEILGFLGPNGSGKTTTIQMLLGTLSMTSGSIFYFGKDFSKHRSAVLQDISFASTYTSLPWLLTVAENLKVYGRLYGLSVKESERRYDPLLERFGILEKTNKRVSSLSAGQVTRLMLVNAFFIQPKIVLLDEPTASLDPDIAREICNFLLEERKRTGLSLLFTSHKMEEVAALCDRTIFLKQGKVIADDLPKKLAKTLSSYRVRLVIVDGMKRTESLAAARKLAYKIDHRTIEISLEEEDIPPFLNALGRADVAYSNIQIEEPSLEEYFLQIARNS